MRITLGMMSVIRVNLCNLRTKIADQPHPRNSRTFYSLANSRYDIGTQPSPSILPENNNFQAGSICVILTHFFQKNRPMGSKDALKKI
jgi:hypothetical protein